MECELCYEDPLEYDQDSLIKHLINEHLAKRTKALEIHVKTISDLENQLTEKGKDLEKRQKLIESKVEEIKDLKNQLTDKDKEHDVKIKALSTKLKTVEKTSRRRL